MTSSILIVLAVICVIVLIPVAWAKLPDRIDPTPRNKILAHIFFSIFDILSIFMLFVAFNEINGIFDALHSHADIVRVGSRVGFYIFVPFVPIVHIFLIVNSLFPVIEKKYKEKTDLCAVALIIALFIIGFGGSAFMKNKVENAGYTYCREASGLSALAKTMVYTKTIDICEKETQKKVAKKF